MCCPRFVRKTQRNRFRKLSSTEPESDAEAQPDDRPASDMQLVVGIAGEVTLNEQLAALQQERHAIASKPRTWEFTRVHSA